MQAWRLGAYELVRQLGEGGMAQVYLARDVRLGRDVAVKVLDQRLAERQGFRDRFLREARLAGSLDHPNIVPLYDFGVSESYLYLVMPYISGGSLQDLLPRAPLPVADVVTYGTQIADALDYAHQRSVIHRDVKPANMLIHADNRVLLSDFGLAKILDRTSQPAAARRQPDAGTPEYMAPEQVEGRTDWRSDIYGLGVVLYLLLTGHLPFTGKSSTQVMEAHLYRSPVSPRQLNQAVTPAVQHVVMRALAKHPEDRFQRAGELGAALLAALVSGDAEPLTFTGGRSSPPHSFVPQSVSLVPSDEMLATPWPRVSTSGFTRPSHGAGSFAPPHSGFPRTASHVTGIPDAMHQPVSGEVPVYAGVGGQEEWLASAQPQWQRSIPTGGPSLMSRPIPAMQQTVPPTEAPRPDRLAEPSSTLPLSGRRGNKPESLPHSSHDRSLWAWIVIMALLAVIVMGIVIASLNGGGSARLQNQPALGSVTVNTLATLPLRVVAEK